MIFYPPLKLKLLMEEENVTFCTINSSCITSPLKQKVYVFSTINPENLLKPLTQTKKFLMDQSYTQEVKYTDTKNVWKPSIPVKKLCSQPRFFLSLQRKKIRIINSIKNMSTLDNKLSLRSQLKGRKMKEGGYSVKKISESSGHIEPLINDGGRSGWEPNFKTPFLNFNMQYLLKKRRSMTPSLYKGLQKMHSTIQLK